MNTLFALIIFSASSPTVLPWLYTSEPECKYAAEKLPPRYYAVCLPASGYQGRITTTPGMLQ